MAGNIESVGLYDLWRICFPKLQFEQTNGD